MKLSTPKMVTFAIAVLLAVIGLIFQIVDPDLIFANSAFWLVLIGFVLLAIGNLFEGI